MITIKENKSYYADKAEEILTYVKENVKDRIYLDVNEAYIADMVDMDEPIIIIPFNYYIKDLDETNPDFAIDQCEFILFYNVDLDTYLLICKDFGSKWEFDIARQETLETCINKLNKFMQNPEKNFSVYNLEIV